MQEYKARPDGLLWAKSTPTSISGTHPISEPGFYARVEYCEHNQIWTVRRFDGTRLSGTPHSNITDAVAEADQAFIAYKQAVAGEDYDPEAEIDVFLESLETQQRSVTKGE